MRSLQPEQARWWALGGLATYNLVQNEVVPDAWYVPVNLAVAGGLIGLARAAGAGPQDLGLDPADAARGLRLGLGAAAVTGLGVAALARSPRGRRLLLDERARGHGARRSAYLATVRYPLGTALFEEVAFRGVLYGLWRLTTTPARAAAVAAGAFGAWHLLPTLRTIPGSGFAGAVRSRRARAAGALTGALVTAAAGVGFTRLRDRSRSVAAPWLAHAAFNSLSYLAARRAWSAAGETAASQSTIRPQ